MTSVNMKSITKPALLSAALGGLIAAALASGAAAASMPDLKGVWKGSATAVHIGATPYRKSDGKIDLSEDLVEFTYTIDQQKGQLFAGKMAGPGQSETLIGSLAPDGKSGVMLDDDGQYAFTLAGPDQIDTCYSHAKKDSKVIACWTLTRQK